MSAPANLPHPTVPCLQEFVASTMNLNMLEEREEVCIKAFKKLDKVSKHLSSARPGHCSAVVCCAVPCFGLFLGVAGTCVGRAAGQTSYARLKLQPISLPDPH